VRFAPARSCQCTLNSTWRPCLATRPARKRHAPRPPPFRKNLTGIGRHPQHPRKSNGRPHPAPANACSETTHAEQNRRPGSWTAKKFPGSTANYCVRAVAAAFEGSVFPVRPAGGGGRAHCRDRRSSPRAAPARARRFPRASRGNRRPSAAAETRAASRAWSGRAALMTLNGDQRKGLATAPRRGAEHGPDRAGLGPRLGLGRLDLRRHVDNRRPILGQIRGGHYDDEPG
jgi:hypothetical protein